METFEVCTYLGDQSNYGSQDLLCKLTNVGCSLVVKMNKCQEVWVRGKVSANGQDDEVM